MEKENYTELLDKVTQMIIKTRTKLREPISPHERLSLTLRFLASGQTFEDLKFSTLIAPQTIGKIVIETCEAIIHVLKDNIKLPMNEMQWKKEAKQFKELWNFPHCIGSIDGKHINITKPPGSGSYYFNYKKNFSIILMAIVNANYEFLMVDVGVNGRASDAGVFKQTKFYEKLESKSLGIPESEILSESCGKIPFVLVADDAFPLTENIMKPYNHNTLKRDEITDYRVRGELLKTCSVY
ncbi:uncharacterized protein LOC129949784 [Eupeodes corollae]|uniref:uncharacterized protein LOC129949784 n=1 Tax=Eupeodes corollae TaxID=290404 RepID=UPI00248F91FE|nr:uncharacterized protein LOC129949784 [Eupeodes corollae]